MGTEVQSHPAQAERQWWPRLVHVLTTPASVFVWIRDDSTEAAAARQEPLTALVFVSGIAIFLATSTAGRFFDDFENNNNYLLLLMECIVAGLLVAIQNFWIVGGAVHIGGRTADSAASYRQARHVVALATAPFVVELVFVWPVRLVMFGGDSDHGVREAVFRVLDGGFLAWSLVLLVVGVRTLNGWRWPRTFASLLIAGVLLALITLLFVGVRFG
jgi:Yip1 domain